MNNQDNKGWESFGDDIRRTIQHAVDEQDYQKLSQDIQKILNTAVYETARGARKVADHVSEQVSAAQENSGTRDQSYTYQGNRSGRGYERGIYNDAVQRTRTMTKTQARETKIGAKIVGTLLAAGGFFIGLINLIFTVACLSLIATEGLGMLFIAAAFAAIMAGAVAAGIAGINIFRMAGRFEEYIRILDGREYIDLKEFAERVGKPFRFIRKDIDKMIRKGWFKHGHLDSTKSTLMVTPEAYQEYRDLEKKKNQFQKEETERRQQVEADLAGLDPEVQEVITRGRSYLAEIHKCNDNIPGEEISAKIAKIEAISHRIFERVKQDPESVEDIHKMMEYYLPTTVKLLKAYEEMDKQPSGGENIRNSKQEIEATLDTLNFAFEKLLDSLFQEQAWDVSTDISVLHTMLAQEGLSGHDLNNLKGHQEAQTAGGQAVQTAQTAGGQAVQTAGGVQVQTLEQ